VRAQESVVGGVDHRPPQPSFGELTGSRFAVVSSGRSMLVEPNLDSMPAIKRCGRGPPRRRTLKLHADKGSDNRRVRRYLRPPRITAPTAGIDRYFSQRLERHRWVVERTIGCLLSRTHASSCVMTAPPGRSPRWPDWPTP
jgi:hypothetical protein